ncbi:MAG: LacI family DNA-binding transcriptional regulator [Betaproteobacteria bacterium]
MIEKPTVRDVARRAGVAVGTVSNVLNGRSIVSAKRRTKVEKAMADLGYVPNRVAQSLRGESHVIGLCTPVTSSAYFAMLLETFERLASGQGYEIMQVLSHGDPALEFRRVEALVGRNVDGVILIPTYDPQSTLDLLVQRSTPAVIVDQVMRDRRFDYVAIDDRKAMRDAITHVIGLGHRSLLYMVRDKRLSIVQRRIEGFKQAAGAARPAVAGAIIQGDPDDDLFARQISKAFASRHPPTALIASNSAIALSLVGILQAMNVRWPDDVSLLAFDEPVWAAIVSPPLAVVRHPIQQIAIEAWSRLMTRLRSPDENPKRITLDAHLVARRSLAPPPYTQRDSKAAGV